MALLRACADAVVVGAGTLRASPGSDWTAEQAFPDLAPELSALRAHLGLSPRPRLVVVTRAGDLDPGHRGLGPDSLILTGPEGAARLPRALSRRALVVEGEGGGVAPMGVRRALLEAGHSRILSEAGPHLTGQMLAAGALDELFLTVSPLLAGRPEGPNRPGLAQGVELLPERQVGADLVSVRRHRDHLFLRYRFSRGPASPV